MSESNLYEMADQKFNQLEWLEDRGRFVRYLSGNTEESVWYCADCGSDEVDAHENNCEHCDGDDL